MVTVPALGDEWKLSEMRDMTKAGRREKKTESRKLKFKQWYRDERGICGNWFTRRVVVFVLFALCVVFVDCSSPFTHDFFLLIISSVRSIGIVLAFTIPRVPSFSFDNTKPLVNATGSFAKSIPTEFSRAPANFSFPAFSDIQVDTGSNFLPLTFNSIHAQVFDLNTNLQVASGNIGHQTLPAKSFPIIQLPLNFTYVAANASDPTCECRQCS